MFRVGGPPLLRGDAAPQHLFTSLGTGWTELLSWGLPLWGSDTEGLEHCPACSACRGQGRAGAGVALWWPLSWFSGSPSFLQGRTDAFLRALHFGLVFFSTEWGEGSRNRQLWECGRGALGWLLWLPGPWWALGLPHSLCLLTPPRLLRLV